MARRKKDPRPARAYINLLQSEPERWGVQVTNLAVLCAAEGDGFFLDTTRHEYGGNWIFPSEKKLMKWLHREGFLPTKNWQYWERPLES